MSEKLFEVKIINSRGAYHHLMRMHGEVSWKHHKWDGPAIIPHRKDSEFKKLCTLDTNPMLKKEMCI